MRGKDEKQRDMFSYVSPEQRRAGRPSVASSSGH